MLSFNWTNVLKNLFAGVSGSNGLKRKSLRGRISAASSEALEQRVLLSAVTFSFGDEALAEGKKNNEDATPKGGKKKQTVVDNPGGLSTSVLYPSLVIDVQPGETVLLGTVQVSRAKGKFYFGGVRIGGEDFGDIFGDVWIADGGRILDKVSANADTVDLGRSSVQVAKKTTKTLQIYGQAESTLVTMEGTFSVIHAQYRLLKNKPNFVHLYGAGSATPKIEANGPIIVNPNPAGFTVYPGLTTIGEGISNNVGFVLNSAPTSNVTLNLGLSSNVFNVNSSTVTFTPTNWNVIQYVGMNAPENSIDEPNQSVNLTVGVNDGLSADNYDPLADQVFTYMFTDNDPTVNPVAGDFSLNLTPTSISEVAGTTTATITLNSTFASSVSIQVATLSGALTGGGTLVFAPGETVKTVTFASVNNNVDEADRQATITATVLAGSDSRFQAGLNKSAVVTVIDDDPTVNPIAGDFTFSLNPSSISENGGVTTGTITLNSTFSSAVSIQVSATAGLTGGTTLVFAPGETVKIVTFSAINNATDEADRVVTITATVLAGSDSRFTVGLNKTATVTIVDDDPTVDPNPQGPEISRFITYLGTMSGILKVKSFTFATNLTSLTHTKAAYDFDGNGDVGSQASEYLSTTVSNVVNGQVTISFDLEIGPGSYGFQIRSRHPGIQNATFTPVSAVVETLDGQTKLVTFTQNPAGGPWFYDTTIAA